MKKKWPFVIGASLLTGVVGLLAFPKKTTPAIMPPADALKRYVGSWEFFDKLKQFHSLKIETTFSIKIDEKILKAVLIELSKEKLVLRDEYGYHIVIQVAEDGSATLYDEAEDAVHELTSR